MEGVVNIRIARVKMAAKTSGIESAEIELSYIDGTHILVTMDFLPDGTHYESLLADIYSIKRKLGIR